MVKLFSFQLFDDRRQLIAEQAAGGQGRATSPAVAMDEINKVNLVRQIQLNKFPSTNSVLLSPLA